MLEIAHQFVPRQSTIDMGDDGEGGSNLLELPWDEAQAAMMQGGHLLKLGVDAIIGTELAQFWITTDDIPMEAIRLSTKISIAPGSTRNLTQDQQAASLIELYTNVLFPTIYEPMQRYDLATKYLQYAAELMTGLDRIEDFLPSDEDIQQFKQQQEQAAQAEAQAEQEAAQQKAAMEQAAGEQKMEIEGQKAGNDQRKADVEVSKDVAKTRLEIAREKFKMRMAQQQAELTKKKSKEA